MKRVSKVTLQSKIVRGNSKLYTEFKKELSCCCCAFNLEPTAIHLHHIDPSIKNDSISDIIIKGFLYEILEELGKVTPLCANCHAIVHNTTDHDLRNTIIESFTTINTDHFIELMHKFAVVKRVPFFEHEDYTYPEFETTTYTCEVDGEGEELEDNSDTFAHHVGLTRDDKGCVIGLDTNENIINLYNKKHSFRYITQWIFGKGRYGDFYNKKIKSVLTENNIKYN